MPPLFIYSYLPIPILVSRVDMQMVIYFIIIGIMRITKSTLYSINVDIFQLTRLESMCYVTIYDLRKFKNVTFSFDIVQNERTTDVCVCHIDCVVCECAPRKLRGTHHRQYSLRPTDNCLFQIRRYKKRLQSRNIPNKWIRYFQTNWQLQNVS